MPHSHQLATTVSSSSLLLQLLLVLALGLIPYSSSASSPSEDVVSYSFPALDDGSQTTAGGGLVVATRSFSRLSPASFLFDALIFPAFNRSEGLVLLSRPVQLWAAAAADAHLIREASFNTTFTVHHGVSTVSFVILLDSFPPLAANNPSSSTSTFAAGISSVEVGAVTSYCVLGSPDVGLNITVRLLNSTASRSSSTVWIEYDAVAHRLRVFVAAAGEPKPHRAIVDASLVLTSRHVTQNALVGFFAAKVRDVIHGVRNWELVLDKFPESGGEDDMQDGRMPATPWLLILLVVLGSMAAVACIVSVLVCVRIWRRRQELKMEHIMKQSYLYPATKRRVATT